LSDEEKKKIYDLHGEEGLKRGAGGHSHDPFGGLFNFGFGQQQQGNFFDAVSFR
jgi:DnaJ-class molecular chaperone